MPKIPLGSRAWKGRQEAKLRDAIQRRADALENDRPLTRVDLEAALAAKANADKLTPEQKEAISEARIEAMEKRLKELESSP